MKRMELIANRSAEIEIVNTLRNNINDLYYSLLPQIPGGEQPNYQKKIVWTNLNFLLICFLEDHDAVKAQAAICLLKEKLPGVGIKIYFTEVS